MRNLEGSAIIVTYLVWHFSVLVASEPATGSLSTNEVYDNDDPSEKMLPQCARGAICGLVEVNAFGVTSVPLCSCPEVGPSCPLVWDQEDGRSVTMGPKQYKFCNKPGPLRMCGREEKAYVSSFYFQPSTFQYMSASHWLACYCPTNTRYLAAAGSEETVEDGLLVVSSLHTCNQLPTCLSSMSCKEVSMADSGTQVEVKCRCPRPQVCPTISADVALHANNYNKGTAYSVYCQVIF